VGTKHKRAAVRIEPINIPPDEIAFDIDGVFANTFKLFVEKARREHGYRFHYEDITEYDFWTVIDMDVQVGETIIQSLIDYPVKSGIRPIEGAAEILTKLSLAGPLLFVTARPDKAPIMEWIQHQLPMVERDLIQIEATNTHRDKLPVLKKNRVRYFVEDRLETCYLLERASIVPIVFDQPWNRKPHHFPAVKGWDEISSMIDW
jgi:5'(3')-deoxyribonucleotidase